MGNLVSSGYDSVISYAEKGQKETRSEETITTYISFQITAFCFYIPGRLSFLITVYEVKYIPTKGEKGDREG